MFSAIHLQADIESLYIAWKEESGEKKSIESIYKVIKEGLQDYLKI